MSVGIIGGGIMGITLGYVLSQQGMKVEIFEASPILGGLAGPILLEDGTAVDRFYHAILTSDSHLRQLCAELGIAGELRFRETRMGFYHRGEIYPMNDVAEFSRFPPLGMGDRVRLGLTVLAAQLVRDWHRLEGTTVEEWLLRWSGPRTYENIWRPMLRAKFDGNIGSVPATYIWARLVRMKSTRDGAGQKERAGHLIGGYFTLINAMAGRIEAAGGRIHLRRPIEEIVIEGGTAQGIRFKDGFHPLDAVVATMPVPIFRRLIPAAEPAYHTFLAQTEYMGIVSPLMVLDRPLTGYWTLNITDDRFPFTGVIETTAYIHPQYVGGHHLVYLPKYTAPGSRWLELPDEDIRDIWLQNVEAMFPHFDRRWVCQFLVHRERYVEPLHGLNATHLIPEVTTPIRNLFLATTGQIYPELTNGESVSRHAVRAARTLLGETERHLQ